MTANRILFVDDDPNILAGYKRSLHKRYVIVTAADGAAGLTCIEKEGPFGVIVADMQMPGMNGVEFLRRAQEQAPETVRLMLTGNADQKTAADAVNKGHVFSFLTKPCPVESLDAALANAVKQYELVMAEKELLEQTLNGAIKVLTEVLSISDPQAFGRAQRLRDEMKTIARWFGGTRSWELELGAMLSQIGFVAVPAAVLVKLRSGGTLTVPERDIILRAPESGAALLERIPRLGTVAEIVRYQNKNFDGSGSPKDGVSGEAIPIGARILRVLNDLLDAESLKRTRAQAFGKLRADSGMYDPKVLEAVAACNDIYLDRPAGSGEPVEVRVRDLVVGSIFMEDICTRDGMLLVTAKTQLSEALLQKLENFHQLAGIREPLLVTEPE